MSAGAHMTAIAENLLALAQITEAEGCTTDTAAQRMRASAAQVESVVRVLAGQQPPDVAPGLAGESLLSTDLQNLLLEGYAALAPVYEPGTTRPAWLAAFALAALRRHAWRPASAPPATLPHGSHYPVTVLGVIDDPRFRINDDDPFVDTVSWWPAEQKWTVTHQVRSDAEVTDHPCRVIAWQPMLELPAPWSELWAGGAA